MTDTTTQTAAAAHTLQVMRIVRRREVRVYTCATDAEAQAYIDALPKAERRRHVVRRLLSASVLAAARARDIEAARVASAMPPERRTADEIEQDAEDLMETAPRIS